MAHGKGHAIDVTAPRSPFYQGPFGRICPDLPPWTPPVGPDQVDDYLLDIAQNLMLEEPGLLPADLTDAAKVADLDARFTTGDAGDPSTGIPAAYTYFGQFVDHDLTFDPMSSLARKNDPNALLNFRTPRFDLDNVYGRGPEDQPYMYDGTGRMLIGNVAGSGLRDLPRNAAGRALIGDMRNDENAMVSQLQLAFLLAHNTLVDRAEAAGHDHPFESARDTLRWLYQWIVWHDFIRRICDADTRAAALSLETTADGRKRWELGLKDVYSWKHQPFMPVEFSVAAYRFGHSMVRNSYQTNHPHRGFGVNAPIFDNTGADDPDDLRGFRPMKASNTIQWDWFLNMTTSAGPFPQRARKIDAKLSNALAHLFEGMSPDDPLNILAFRNLKRGISFDLPSGTDVARKWCIDPIELDANEPDALWYYILKEGEIAGGEALGKVGSTIVAATFAGLLKGDPHSYLNLRPCWTPDDDPLLRSGEDNVDTGGTGWELSSLIRLAGLPVDAADIETQSNAAPQSAA